MSFEDEVDRNLKEFSLFHGDAYVPNLIGRNPGQVKQAILAAHKASLKAELEELAAHIGKTKHHSPTDLATLDCINNRISKLTEEK